MCQRPVEDGVAEYAGANGHREEQCPLPRRVACHRVARRDDEDEQADRGDTEDDGP